MKRAAAIPTEKPGPHKFKFEGQHCRFARTENAGSRNKRLTDPFQSRSACRVLSSIVLVPYLPLFCRHSAYSWAYSIDLKWWLHIVLGRRDEPFGGRGRLIRDAEVNDGPSLVSGRANRTVHCPEPTTNCSVPAFRATTTPYVVLNPYALQLRRTDAVGPVPFDQRMDMFLTWRVRCYSDRVYEAPHCLPLKRRYKGVM